MNLSQKQMIDYLTYVPKLTANFPAPQISSDKNTARWEAKKGAAINSAQLPASRQSPPLVRDTGPMLGRRWKRWPA